MLTRPRYNVCVFGGAYPGFDPIYTSTANALGAALAQHHFGLIYGGAGLGVMGAIADGCLRAGGYVEGILPEALRAYNIAHPSLSQLTIVESLEARLAHMSKQADAFIILPGGFGTLDEAFTVITAAQLALHVKPIALLNVAHYYDALLTWIEHACTAQFITSRDTTLVQIYSAVTPLLQDLCKILYADRDMRSLKAERQVELQQDVLRLQHRSDKNQDG